MVGTNRYPVQSKENQVSIRSRSLSTSVLSSVLLSCRQKKRDHAPAVQSHAVYKRNSVVTRRSGALS